MPHTASPTTSSASSSTSSSNLPIEIATLNEISLSVLGVKQKFVIAEEHIATLLTQKKTADLLNFIYSGAIIDVEGYRLIEHAAKTNPDLNILLTPECKIINAACSILIQAFDDYAITREIQCQVICKIEDAKKEAIEQKNTPLFLFNVYTQLLLVLEQQSNKLITILEYLNQELTPFGIELPKVEPSAAVTAMKKVAPVANIGLFNKRAGTKFEMIRKHYLTITAQDTSAIAQLNKLVLSGIKVDLDFADETTLNCAMIMRNRRVIKRITRQGIVPSADTFQIALLSEDSTCIRLVMKYYQDQYKAIVENTLKYCSAATNKVVGEYLQYRAALASATKTALVFSLINDTNHKG